MVEKMMTRTGLVIATGGGTVVNPQNLANLKSCGVVIALTADIPTILQRTEGDASRPLLQTQTREAREEKIRTLLQSRMSAYSQADLMLDTSAMTVDEVAHRILESTTNG
jgi:shikimate kinase